MCKVTIILLNSATKYSRNPSTFINSKCNTKDFYPIYTYIRDAELFKRSKISPKIFFVIYTTTLFIMKYE